MAPQFRFPYPCQYYPLLRTQHEAATLIAEGQAGGHDHVGEVFRIGLRQSVRDGR